MLIITTMSDVKAFYGHLFEGSVRDTVSVHFRLGYDKSLIVIIPPPP